MEHIEELPQKYLAMLGQGDDKGRIICDYNAPTTMQLSYQNQTNHDLAMRR